MSQGDNCVDLQDVWTGGRQAASVDYKRLIRIADNSLGVAAADSPEHCMPIHLVAQYFDAP